MLLVDDDEAEVGDGDGVLEQGVSTDGDVDLTGLDLFVDGRPRGLAPVAGEDGDAPGPFELGR